MAINPESEYVGKINAATPEYPYGSARNVTVPGDGTGTPFVASFVNDLFGWQQATLSYASTVPSGTPEEVGASQYLTSMRAFFGDKRQTVAAMKSAPLAVGTTVQTEGYTTAGDGGDGVYTIVAAGAPFDNLIDHELSGGDVAVLDHNGSINIKQAGGVSGADSRANGQAIIAKLLVSGGDIILPLGDWVLDPVASDDTIQNGLLVPFNTFTETPSIRFKGKAGAVLKAGGNNMMIVRASNAGVQFRGVDFDGDGNTGVWGVGSVAEDRFADVGVVSQSHLKVQKCNFRQLDEGVVGEPAIQSGGQDSGAYYPQVEFCDFAFCTRSMWFKGATDASANRPTRGNLHYNRMERGNTGIDLEYATEFTCSGNNFEFINIGVAPLTSPSAYHLGALSENNYIYGGHAENCTLDIHNEATVPNNMLFGFTLLGSSVGTEFMPIHTADTCRVTNPTAVDAAVAFEAKNPAFGRLVFDFAAANQKSAAIELNSARQMEWFNGVTTHVGSADDLSLSATGQSLSGTGPVQILASTFARISAASDAVYLRLGANDVLRATDVSWRPYQTNTTSVGEPSLLMSVIYAATGAINTSDENFKTQSGAIPDTVLDAWDSVPIKRYKFTDAVEKKGDTARWHVGRMAQDVVKAFAAVGEDAYEWGVLCFDAWAEQVIDHPKETAPLYGDVETMDEDGKVTGTTHMVVGEKVTREAWVETIPAGERYGLRYGEAAVLDAAVLDRRLKRIENG
jgi:hypothetical protein